jgi:glutathione synthase/RimK-type ligase-like ATP-grasp enzyme
VTDRELTSISILRGHPKVTVLILGSRYDLTCDYVIAQLRRLDANYLRLNSEDLPQLLIALDPLTAKLTINRSGDKLSISPREVTSILYRRPVYLRDYGLAESSPVEAFARQHWAVFMRSLMVIDTARWVNHPSATYLAEHKAVQLHVANMLGFAVPRTVFANDKGLIPPAIRRQSRIALKGIDTVLLREGNAEAFGFTQLVSWTDLTDEDLQSVPVALQEVIEEKLDIRVTVVGSRVFAVSIDADGGLIEGDWRVVKEKARFSPFELPSTVADMCVRLVARLGLAYGAIDLALAGGEYYFFEINPTGEWAWLVKSAGLPIDVAIAQYLIDPGTVP